MKVKRIIEIEESILKDAEEGHVRLGEIADAVIKNGKPYTEPTGDCISREDLKKAMWSLVINENDDIPVLNVIEAIDNAPPVEAYTLEDMQNNYDAGVDSVIGKYDKAKGEWQGGELGHCTKCGHKGSASDIWSGCVGMFCPNCGANLKGGAE